MSGHVGVIANDAARYTLFSICLSDLASQAPTNTQLLWRLTTDLANGRNWIVEQALEAGSEWVMFLDDDHAFPPYILKRLLAHDVPIVGALYLQRARPFRPIAYSAKDEETEIYTHLRLPDLPDTGLVPVRAMGAGGLLIRSEVFREIPRPWFEHVRASEDLTFCDKAHAAGIPMFVDCGVRLGHLGTSSMWPSHHEGEWTVGFQLADGFALHASIETEE